LLNVCRRLIPDLGGIDLITPGRVGFAATGKNDDFAAAA